MDLSIIKKALGNFRAIHGRAPTAAEMAQLEKQAASFARPTSGLRSGPSAAPRAAYELGTDLNLINPDKARDPFLTKMLTGRTTKGTNLRPMAQDITDPSVIKNIEAQQMGGKLDELLPNTSSVTPSADYFAKQSQAIENEALSGGSLDKLKQGFYEAQGRYPDEDELNAVIAEFNPSRHQYGAQGVGIMSERPPTAKGMSDWRNAARNEGVEESYLFKRQGNYPQYIQDELAIQRGELPAAALKEPKKKRYKEVEPADFYIDENGVPVKIYPTMKAEGGRITTGDMLAQMIVNQITPQKFAKGAAVKRMAAPAAINAGLFAPELSTMGKNLAKGKYGEAAGSLANIGLALAPINPATVGLSLMAPSDTGDATLDTWNKQKEAEAQAYREYLRQTSPVFREEAPADYIDFMKELGYK